MVTKPRKTPSKEPKALGGDISNAGAEIIAEEVPYRALIEVTGDCPILFCRWQCDSVAAKAAAAKGSTAKKTDDVESYVWRDENEQICLPGEYLRGSVVGKEGSAKYRQDPRNPRQSAQKLCRAGIVALTDGPITRTDGSKAMEWDYLDRRRAVVNGRGAVTRERPALRTGWNAEIVLQIQTPQYITPELLRVMLHDAGRLVGVGDFRPTFGRYSVTKFELL